MDNLDFLEYVRVTAQKAGHRVGPHERKAYDGQKTLVWVGTEGREVAVTAGGPIVHVRFTSGQSQSESVSEPPTREAAERIGNRIVTFLV